MPCHTRGAEAAFPRPLKADRRSPGNKSAGEQNQQMPTPLATRPRGTIVARDIQESTSIHLWFRAGCDVTTEAKGQYSAIALVERDPMLRRVPRKCVSNQRPIAPVRHNREKPLQFQELVTVSSEQGTSRCIEPWVCRRHEFEPLDFRATDYDRYRHLINFALFA